MYGCPLCKAVYLRESDAKRCSVKEMETPLIQIGDILRGHGYGGDVIVRCHAIIPYGHRIHYRLEWRVRGEDRWATAFQVAGNDSLREFLHRQGNGRNAN